MIPSVFCNNDGPIRWRVFRRYVYTFWHNTGSWQTDRRTIEYAGCQEEMTCHEDIVICLDFILSTVWSVDASSLRLRYHYCRSYCLTSFVTCSTQLVSYNGQLSSIQLVEYGATSWTNDSWPLYSCCTMHTHAHLNPDKSVPNMDSLSEQWLSAVSPMRLCESRRLMQLS